MKESQLVEFYNQKYVPSLTTLILAGDFELQKTSRKLISLFKREEKNRVIPITRISPPAIFFR